MICLQSGGAIEGKIVELIGEYCKQRGRGEVL